MKRTHRNRYSLTHLSTETTATLPEYAPTSGGVTWQHQPPVRVQQHKPAKMYPEFDGTLSDRPPDYPDSADEADEETDSVAGDEEVVYADNSTISLPTAPGAATPSPRRHFRRYSSSTSSTSFHPHYDRHNPNLHHHHHHAHRPHPPYRRYKSSVVLPSPSPVDDPYLDSLLARSVHALEMSNTLLQSLSALLHTPVPFREISGVGQLEERTKGLSRKIDWVDDLEKIRKDVERLFGDGVNEGEEDVQGDDDGESLSKWTRPLQRRKEDIIQRHEAAPGGVSSSLPASSSMPASRAYKRRPSQLDLQNSGDDQNTARLTYSPQYRSRLISPAPRAITQYVVASSADPDVITLPSTLGTRTSSHHSIALTPQLTDRLPEPTTRAYNMLASFVQRTPTSIASTPSSVTSTSVLASLMPKMRRRSNSSNAAISGGEVAEGNNARRKRRSTIDDDPRLQPPSADGLRGRTPKSPLPVRPMTPPTEESTGSSSSSSESLIAKLTVMSLRKILDEQAARSETAPNASDIHVRQPFKAPAFFPVTPAVPQASTSNATASISRLFTKAIHTSSTRPPSPPRHSAMKHASGSRSALSASARQPEASTSSAGAHNSNTEIDAIGTTNGMLSVNAAKAQLGMLPELVSAGISRAFGVRPNSVGSATSSGQSTPKRISFAELPEGTRPEGRSSSRFKEKQAQKKRRKLLNGRGRRNATVLSGGDNEDVWDGEGGSPPTGGWWSGWLGGGTAEAESALAGMGGSSGGMYVSRYEDRMESRLSRSWSGLGRLTGAPEFGDEWAV
ncbi:hypothetical protein F5887DRAFT_965858 [Amanita rubescens]|nr:hypothetical protein F5887DRAFT_965858 [Amanita rubescens]